MRLNKLITPTMIGQGDGQIEAWVRLLGHQDLENYPFLKEIIFASRDDVDFCWLANDSLYKERSNMFKNYSDGCYSLQDKKHYPIERKIDEPWEDDIYRYIYNISIKTRNNYEPTKCRFNTCLCVEMDVNTYLQLTRLDKSYLPYEVQNRNQKYHCIELGDQFDIRTGLKGNQKIQWCVLNPEVLLKAVKSQTTNKTDAKVLLCDLGTAGMSNFIFGCENLEDFKQCQENRIFRDLNGIGDIAYSFIDHVFIEELAMLKNAETKKTTVIATKPSALKREFLKAMQTNPDALRELIPLMKEFINAEENRTL